MLERRDQGNHGTLVSRDQAWLNSLHSSSQSLRLMTLEQVNIRVTEGTQPGFPFPNSGDPPGTPMD